MVGEGFTGLHGKGSVPEKVKLSKPDIFLGGTSFRLNWVLTRALYEEAFGAQTMCL
ncbi:conserved hypothetical protein [Ricinus communis]|uniref:Uncharacterized protein n=1 Tax=Ricinus communis TaxID=3988 RepID=B9RW15_RICCO|nr:conserved hypothetical protein [Ricinus communis]